MSKLASIIARQVYVSAGRTYEAFDNEEAAKDAGAAAAEEGVSRGYW